MFRREKMKKGPRYFTIRGKRSHLKSAREREIADREVDTIIAGGPWNNWNRVHPVSGREKRERGREKKTNTTLDETAIIVVPRLSGLMQRNPCFECVLRFARARVLLMLLSA